MNTFLKVLVDVTQICIPTHQFMGDHISSPIPNLKILSKIQGGSENEANKGGGVGI